MLPSWEDNISPEKPILKMIFLFPRWDMLISLEGIQLAGLYLNESCLGRGCKPQERRHAELGQSPNPRTMGPPWPGVGEFSWEVSWKVMKNSVSLWFQIFLGFTPNLGVCKNRGIPKMDGL